MNRDTAISIAGTTSLLLNGFTRYAIAPASRARSTSSRCENAVSISTGAMLSSAIFSAAEIPSSTGIFTSRITRSGRCSRASSTARLPVTGLTDDGVALLLQHLFEIETDQRLVLGDHDAGRQRRDVRLVVVGRYGLSGSGALTGLLVQAGGAPMSLPSSCKVWDTQGQR